MPASARIGSLSTAASWSRLRLMIVSALSRSLKQPTIMVSSTALGMPTAGRQRARKALRAGRLERRHVRERVAVEEAVVAAFPLEDLVFARVGAGQAHGRLRGLAAGVGEAHFVDAGDGLDDLAPHFVVELVGERVEHAALGDLRDDRVEDGLGPVAEDHRPVADAPVDVGVAVHIEEVGSFAAVHHDRARADESRVARLTTGDDLLAFGEHLARLDEVTVVDEVVVHGALDSFTNGRARRGHPRVWGRVPGGCRKSTG